MSDEDRSLKPFDARNSLMLMGTLNWRLMSPSLSGWVLLMLFRMRLIVRSWLF